MVRVRVRTEAHGAEVCKKGSSKMNNTGESDVSDFGLNFDDNDNINYQKKIKKIKKFGIIIVIQ